MNTNIDMSKNPKLIKLMKKAYGKHLGREIAFGRKLVKMINKVYEVKYLK